MENNMKKLTALLIILLAAVGIFADTDLDPDDLLYLTPMNRSIFPELDYKTNPAFLINIKEKFLSGNIEIETEYDADTKTRTDDSIGASGGTETTADFSIAPGADFVILGPTEKKNVFGFGLNYDSDHRLDTVTDLKFNGATEHLQSELTDNVFSAGTDFYFATKPSKDMYLGFSGGYNFNYDSAVYKWITDSTVNPASSYTETLSEPDNSNDLTHGWQAAFGINLPTDELEFRFGFDYQGSFTDSSDEYVEVDTNGDGFNDKVYSLYDYLDLPAIDGGPTDATLGKDFVHYSLHSNVDLNAGMVWDYEMNKSLILNGSWKPLGLTYNHYAKHITTASIKTDKSFFDKYYNSGLGTFDVKLAFDFYDKAKKTTFRIGGGYARYAESLSQKGDTAAGLMVFSSQNTGNYTELNLGLEPANDVLSDSGLYPAEQVIHSAMVDANWRWTPENKVTLFLDIGVSAWYDTRSYRVFNLDTRTVWEEKVVSSDIDLLLGSSAGISFPMGEKITCKVDLQNIGTLGDFSFVDDTHMYDTEIQRYSANGEKYLFNETNMDFKLNLSFQWRL